MTVYYHLIIKLNKNHYIYDQFSIIINKFNIYILILKFRFSILILDFYWSGYPVWTKSTTFEAQVSAGLLYSLEFSYYYV